MKRIISLCFFILLAASAHAQVNFTGTLPYRTMPENAWDGIDVSINLGLAGSTSAGGVSFLATAYDKKINSIKIRQREIDASQIPAHVLAKLKNDMRVTRVTFDLYVNSNFVKTMTDNTTIGWAEMQGLATAEGYKQAVKDEGYKLFNSGALAVKNVSVDVSYRLDPNYYNTIVKEITGSTTANTPPGTVANNNVTELGLSTSSSSSSDGTNENPLVNQPATTGGLPVNTSGNDPLANYTPSSAYSGATTEKEVYVQAAATVVGGLLDEMNANYERKQARLEAESRADISRSYDEDKRKRRTKFVTEFYPLLTQAEDGDVNARMILYYASESLKSEELVPKREQWFNEAYANNNTDARSRKSYINIPDLEENAVATGNIDAMVRLGMWYSAKVNYMGLTGGGDEQKALEWFSAAAAAGSPNAMYFLGMIYRYGTIVPNKYEQKLFIKFTVAKDEKTAFDWFIKADQPDYKESIYSRSTTNEPFLASSSFYIPDARIQIYLLYKNGKVVKDKAKAEKMKAEIEGIRERYYPDDIKENLRVNGHFGDIDRYK